MNPESVVHDGSWLGGGHGGLCLPTSAWSDALAESPSLDLHAGGENTLSCYTCSVLAPPPVTIAVRKGKESHSRKT